MWMKAELTKGPHSCPAGPTAPLVDLVQHQGRCDPLHRARPRLRKHGAAPSENAEPRSPSPGSGVETAYFVDTAPRRRVPGSPKLIRPEFCGL